MARRVSIERLRPGARFRFAEESRWLGFPYHVLDTPATVKGTRLFAEGTRPVVIRSRHGRYPRYGHVQGFFPVRDNDGRLVHWVVHPETEVLVPSWVARTIALLLALLVLLGLAAVYWFVYQLR
ncbi:MAG TPA: hypothetical protein V6D05_10760 [Stenomitos sp.]